MTNILAGNFYPKNTQFISPGPVGSVGDVLCQTKLKHSNPDMPIRWEYWNSGPNEIFLGSNVQDGQHIGYVSGGDGATTVTKNWGKRRTTEYGWRIQDLNTNTNMLVPDMGSLGDYDWRNKQATVYESNRTGYKFLPLPHGYNLPPGEQQRAGGPQLQQIISYGAPHHIEDAEQALRLANPAQSRPEYGSVVQGRGNPSTVGPPRRHSGCGGPGCTKPGFKTAAYRTR